MNVVAQLVSGLVVACLLVPCNSLCYNTNQQVICDDLEDIQFFEDLELVTALSVNNSQIQFKCETPSDFSELSNLTTLSIRKRHFGFINTKHCFDDLDQLRGAFFSQSSVEEVDFSSLNGSMVKVIFLDRNNISSIDLGDNQMPELLEFEMSYNLLSNFTLTSESMPKIKKIFLTHNNITKFLIESESLQELYLESNLIEGFKADDLVTPQLLMLDLSYNNLLTLTAEMIKNAPKIEHLFLQETLLTKLELSRTSFVVYIDLSSTQIRSLTDIDLQSLQSASQIDLTSNRILELSNSDGKEPVENIGYFICVNCSINHIDRTFFTTYMKNLTTLILAINHIRTLDHFRSSQNLNLTNLSLPRNFITKIERMDLEKLPLLESLDLTSNKIETIDEGSFDALSKLRILSLAFNCIKRLPNNLFDNLNSIAVIRLGNNLFTYFPIPGWNETTNTIQTAVDHPLLKVENLIVASNPFQCSCYSLLLEWMQSRFAHFDVIQDFLSRQKLQPECIFTSNNCTSHYDKDVKNIFAMDSYDCDGNYFELK